MRGTRLPLAVCRGGRGSAFTLLELLVATAVLILLLTITLQIISNVNTAVRGADRQMDAATQTRAAMDRFGADFSTAMLNCGASALFVPATSSTSTAIGFLCRSRAREASGGAPDWQANIRGAIVGYRMQPQSLRDDSYQALCRGDGRLTFNKVDLADRAACDLSTVFSGMAASLVAPNNTSMLAWTSLGAGIVRFHVSFQLDNGAIVQTPPTYYMTSPQTGNPVTFLNGASTSGCLAIAFSAQNAPDTAHAARPDLAGRYVKALIVGMAAIDRKTLQQASSQLSQVADLGTPGLGDSPETDTPLFLWESNLGKITSLPLRQNIRFYQRTIPAP